MTEQVSPLCFGEQNSQRRNPRIPLDQRRDAAKPLDRLRIQRPDGFVDRRPVIVNQNLTAIGCIAVVPGEMDLRDRGCRQDIQISDRVDRSRWAGIRNPNRFQTFPPPPRNEDVRLVADPLHLGPIRRLVFDGAVFSA